MPKRLPRAEPTALAVLESRGTTRGDFGIRCAVLAEMTHRCPLQCPYCSNPVEPRNRGGSELTTAEWQESASPSFAEIGYCSYNSPAENLPARKDLVELVQKQGRRAVFQSHHIGGVVTREKLAALANAGLFCTCRSSALTGHTSHGGRPCAGFKNAHAKKKDRSAKWTRGGFAADGPMRDCHGENRHQLPEISRWRFDLDDAGWDVPCDQY